MTAGRHYCVEKSRNIFISEKIGFFFTPFVRFYCPAELTISYVRPENTLTDREDKNDETEI